MFKWIMDILFNLIDPPDSDPFVVPTDNRYAGRYVFVRELGEIEDDAPYGKVCKILSHSEPKKMSPRWGPRIAEPVSCATMSALNW